MNNVSLVGRLVRDPELRYTTSGMAFCYFTIAVDREFKGSGGRREADFIPIKMWGRPAENIANFVSKGSLVSLTGKIESRNYEDTVGNKKYVVEVIAEDIKYLDLRKDASSEAHEIPPDSGPSSA